MKLFKMTFAALGILAAIAIALGAYWHIYTLGICAAMVYAIRKEERPKNGNRQVSPRRKYTLTETKVYFDQNESIL